MHRKSVQPYHAALVLDLDKQIERALGVAPACVWIDGDLNAGFLRDLGVEAQDVPVVVAVDRQLGLFWVYGDILDRATIVSWAAEVWDESERQRSLVPPHENSPAPTSILPPMDVPFRQQRLASVPFTLRRR